MYHNKRRPSNTVCWESNIIPHNALPQMDVRNRGCKSLIQPEKESTIPTVILGGSFLLPAQPWERGEQGACVKWGSLLHTLVHVGEKWSVRSTGNSVKMCPGSELEGLRKKRMGCHLVKLRNIGEEILLRYKTTSLFFLISA